MTEPLSTTQRVLRVLTVLGESPTSLGVQQIAERVGLHMSSAHRIVNALVEENYALYDPQRRLYSAGTALMRLAGLAEVNGPAEILRPYLDSLSERFDESVLFNLYIPETHQMAITLKSDGTQPLRYSLPLHETLSIALGASGRSLLAYLDEEVIREVWESSNESSPGSVPPFGHFVQELANVRKQGWAASDGERIPGARSVASVVRSHRGRVVGGICITFPRDRTPAPIEELGEAISEAARDASRFLGDVT